MKTETTTQDLAQYINDWTAICIDIFGTRIDSFIDIKIAQYQPSKKKIKKSAKKS